MSLVLIMNFWMFICSLAGLCYGVHHFFRIKKVLYLQMITCGIGCLMYARLFFVIFLFTQGELNQGFHVGLLGIMGSFMFLLSANYGQMDGLVDDGTKTFFATRIKALLVPVLITLLYVFLLLKTDNLQIRIAAGLLTLFILPCSYYNFKHVIIYDVELGIIRSLRKYNILAVIYAFLVMFECIGTVLNIRPLYVVSCIGIGLIALMIIPVVKGGAGKWTI